ncbi:methionyl-tRNA formyltransferase [Streptoalloteichus tenebrarius]|uniref:Methionyl-tRNA formyltransferase n=1 Tax=Streptoalloteichus tenebrarius (strain ATCC 17920 / DSM 40477 / JCM 4838 / CBS 697.72 / NBRC 16177 / NCIMB 11028 / NRRL B-12390 / A12253. 1 / ISP 5477) TaxID=1933 RepID=A0ABT1HSZ2_STRSD|nr:methionyl-tRNA formyltransferase [Streptoalloteichus tenebrarius]MCP2258622.1 methionyl-tRNA formyltransferase [Streptoalloteichus tenebrarius]BFF04005.1 methionyl-tRNA formyltransferase [Streptoalloteichus tenebrarius]
MRLVFAGTPAVALPALRALLDSPRHEVVAVVTRPDAPAGRGRRLVRSPVGALADERGIEVLTPARAGDPDFLARLRELAPDCCPVVAYGALLPKSALEIPPHGWINLHFSLLPAWRGAAPVQAAVRHGDEITGASTFRIVRELDAGPVFGTVTEPVRPRDTAGELLDRLADSGARLLLSTLDGIEDGAVVAVEQPAEGVSYAPKVTADDARVDFTLPALAVDRLVRSVSPEPGAWSVFRGERVKLGPVQPSDVDGLAPGELRVEKRRVLVGTATTAVELGEVQAQGKKRMAAPDWARGSRIEAGERLG